MITVEPAGEFGGALVGVGVGSDVGPPAGGGLDEALRFAVGFGGLESRAKVFEPVAGSRLTPCEIALQPSYLVGPGIGQLDHLRRPRKQPVGWPCWVRRLW